MRASLRCKEHFQGDRCHRPLDHPDAHTANWVVWAGDKILVRWQPQAPRRNRLMNRTYRIMVPRDLRPLALKDFVQGIQQQWRKVHLFQLDRLVRYFKGENVK